MAIESESKKREFQRWSRLAIQFLGSADSGKFDHLTTAVVTRALEEDRLFELLVAELPQSVWEISQLTDVDRHTLSQHWRLMAQAYDPAQFHVSRSGLALLAAYLLHLIDVGHATIPA
jgi:hypothetical protein